MDADEFRERYVREDIVVHCSTYEKAEKFLTMADSFGYRWCDGGSFIGDFEFDENRENTCYNIYLGEYSDLEFYVNDHRTIVPFQERDVDWTYMEIIEPPTKESQYRHLLEEYDELDDRVLEILDIVKETVGLNVELDYYKRDMGMRHDDFYVGDYHFPIVWFWFDDDKIKEQLLKSKYYSDLKEQQIREEELVELKRLKEKYEYFY